MTAVNAADGANVELVRGFWEALGRRDFDAVGSFMAPDGHYVDVPVKDIDPGARWTRADRRPLASGPRSAPRLRADDGPIVASGGYVITEHSETWRWSPASR